jgi:GTP pyrophosphokinase
MGSRQEGYRGSELSHDMLTFQGVLAGERREAPFTVSHLPTREPLAATWHYCQAKIAQRPEATFLLARGVAMVERLARFMMHSDNLQAALLFPLVDAGHITPRELSADCSPTISSLVQGVVQMAVIEPLNLLQQPLTPVQLSKRRCMLLAMLPDVHCVVIKLVERIVYLEAIKAQDLTLQQSVARVCQQLYAPLANYLGISQFKWELEDLSLRALSPQAYWWLAFQLQKRRSDREQEIAARVCELHSLLASAGLSTQISGRPKHLCSIWQKLQNKSKSFEQLFDVRALRIIVEEVSDCYTVLSLLHARHRSLPEEFVDYIVHPKPNGYQSIHTVLLDSQGEPMEIQIRTTVMHQAAELGVAAHWRYKADAVAAGERHSQQRILGLRQLLAWDALAMESVPQPLLADRWIYLFTPRGEVVELPAGATPLDFAYGIHTEIGHRCIGAIVAGRIVPLTYRLQLGEQVTILTQKAAQPRRDWLNPHYGFVTTRRARVKIRAWLDQQDRLQGLHDNQAPPKTRALVRKANADRVGLKASQPLALLRQRTPTTVPAMANQPGKSIRVAGMDNILVTFARCCRPTPGERISGFITRGRGISIHRVGCHRLNDLQDHMPARLVSVQWCNGMLHSNTT